jgi:phage recombination protein Bet
MPNLAITASQDTFTPAQIAALRSLGAEKASAEDFAVFFHLCKRTGLDPFAKQVYLVGRWDARAQRERYTIQTAIDGARLIAERTGAYAGSDEEWETDEHGKLVSATVTVKKVVAGAVCTFKATAHWSEYAQTTKEGKPSGLWSKMPRRMLAKCAESLALRKAFPADLSGIYTTEEMSNADSTPVIVEQPQAQPEEMESPTEDTFEKLETQKPAAAVTAAQIRRIHTIKTTLGIEDEKYRDRLQKLYSVASSKDLTKQQAADLIKRMEAAGPA